MPDNRFYLDAPLTQGSTPSLSGEQLHHIRVMRKDIGDHIELVNGKGSLAKAQITAIDKRDAHLLIQESTSAPPPSRQVILAQALLKPKNLDLVIEKGTELGATAFWLFPADRSEKSSLSPNQQARLHHLAISALKQSGRLYLPEIALKPPLSEWTAPPMKAFFGDLSPEAPRFSPPDGDLLIFIGPEKGFSDEEIALLQGPLKGTGVRLSPNTLRAETAALCALSLVSN
ncbi:MAG: Ribosomal RNA small subunit methyltransferase E [Chlamydiae bacterium]|nr:Ribosomal RNA small subunit methyltransferase E [Chlamydiota bacterium]